MMTLYQIQGTITRDDGSWASTRQIPTFYLDSSVQGILNADHALRVARDIVDTIAGPPREGETVSSSLSAYAIDAPATVPDVAERPASPETGAAIQSPPLPTMATTLGDVVMVDGVPRVVTSAISGTYQGKRTLSLAHVAPGDESDPTATANAAVITLTAPDVRAFPV